MRVRTRLRLWWNQLWLRSDEFHFDAEACSEMTPEDRAEYMADLARRRYIAHLADLEREDRKRVIAAAADAAKGK